MKFLPDGFLAICCAQRRGVISLNIRVWYWRGGVDRPAERSGAGEHGYKSHDCQGADVSARRRA